MTEFWGNLTTDVRLEDVELGQEILIRARVVTLEEETIDVRRLGGEPQVVQGFCRAKLMPLDVHNTGTSPE